MIQIRKLNQQYKKGEWALHDVNLTIDSGMFGLLGPNGAGKTTLMRILTTLQKPSSGEVTIGGIPLSRPEEIRRRIGYLPQAFQIYPQLTAGEFLDYVGVMKGMNDSRERSAEIERLLGEVNLSDKINRKVKTFSGGMKQRLGIAQALMGNPQVLVIDEPTAGLDPEERVRFRNLMSRFSRDRIVILSTHIVADIQNSCRRLAVLNRGNVMMSGSLDELMASAEGKVWDCEMTESEYAQLDATRIISSIRMGSGHVQCRILSSRKPVENAKAAVPTLEDGYLALIGGESDV
ncbi:MULTISPECIES: ABC transporter ATP-binding protein [unclassified Paenibacillus]|uniref:ABC transporter ATP-binding protein n=1 Tax=unclassified Paenibacillus TaxID=185978 RepID=UPI001AE9BB89|nr:MULTISPECIES: ABC transporter ATP-binding protein [unclassified Paenibacillus]MBP1154668.1 ABC-type multidrug transport system ATPase subunit [Paenibacillus sp. PvP091]MBP1169948.1 ABC-type multidrug transport system ATPase subunit [Paenibacillus sp. PvR098]MBP2440976.1 ABC-type multidrug transport system ATPase subunit [Paenibacillus sp. PvP052]